MITIPTVAELYASYVADIEAAFGITLPDEGKNFLRALASVQAGKMKLLYLAVGNTQKNIWPDSADSESVGGTLERFGRVRLGRNPFPPQAAQYSVSVTGTIGATIPAGQVFKADDDSLNPSQLYILDSAYTLVASPDTITVRALVPGIISGQNVGNTMTATSPILNVNSQATITAENVEPKAAEDLEAYRTATLLSYRLEAQGGAATDYRLWALDAQGVKQVYPYATNGEVAEIDIYIEATIADSTDGKGTPSAGLIDDVEEVIDFNPDTSLPTNERGRKPLGVFQINYYPITPLDVVITINDFVGINATKEGQIEDALEELLSGIRPFVAAADVLEDKNDILDVNRIISAILTVLPGSVFGAIQLEVDGSPYTSFTFTEGNIPYLDSVVFD